MGDLVYFCPGCDRIGESPNGLKAMLSNVPDILGSRASAQKIFNLLNYAKPKLRMLDSGGKQIFNVTSGKSRRFKNFVSIKGKPIFMGNTLNLHPLHLKEAAIKFHPHITTALDYPVAPAKDLSQQQKGFKDSIEVNVQWARESIEIRNIHLPETQIFLPFHGFSIEHLDHFLDRVGTMAFDGLSLPMRIFRDSGRLLDLLLHIRNRKIKKIHLLGTSRMDVILLAAYLAKQDQFDFISFDSGTPAIAARKENFLRPSDLRQVKIRDHLAMREISRMPTECLCDICKEKLNLGIQQLPRKEKRKLLLDHNYAAIEMATRKAFSNAGSPRQIKIWLQKVSERRDFHEKVVRLLEKIN
jgi:tRNA-guanine family transglycosylase